MRGTGPKSKRSAGAAGDRTPNAHEAANPGRREHRSVAAPARRHARAVRTRRRRHLAARLRRGQADHLLHVRLPLRHRRAHRRRQGPLHPGQQAPPGQSRRDLRQGQRRHHAALQPGAAQEAAAPGRRARRRRFPRDRMGGGAFDRERAAREDPRHRSEAPRLLHRPRPVAVADRLVGAAIRHAELRRAWRLLLRQHGGRRALHDRRLVLGVRRAGLGPHKILHALRRRRGPRFQSDQDRARQAQGARREDRRGQSGPHRLRRHRRRMDRHPSRHRRALHPCARARAAEGRQESISTISSATPTRISS